MVLFDVKERVRYLLCLLQQHPTSAPVCEQGCSLLAALASELSRQQRAVVAQNARGLVLAALQHPPARTQAGAAMTVLAVGAVFGGLEEAIGRRTPPPTNKTTNIKTNGNWTKPLWSGLHPNL